MADKEQITKSHIVYDALTPRPCIRYLRSFNEIEIILTRKESKEELIEIICAAKAPAKEKGLTLRPAYPIEEEA